MSALNKHSLPPADNLHVTVQALLNADGGSDLDSGPPHSIGNPASTTAKAILRNRLPRAVPVTVPPKLPRARRLGQKIDVSPPLALVTARSQGPRQIDLANYPADPRLALQYGLANCLRDSLMPLRKIGEITLVASGHPERFFDHLKKMQALFGPVSLHFAPADSVESALLSQHGPVLAQAAETRAPLHQSARSWNIAAIAPYAAAIAAVSVMCLWVNPIAFGQGVLGIAFLTLILCLCLKIAATLATLCTKTAPPRPSDAPEFPSVSIIVALYRESDIAARLVDRLSRLEYPRHLLDVILAVEIEDHLTREALRHANLPGWMRVIVVPAGTVKTKPRALNFALDQCRGSIIGVYDAEDAPDPHQILQIVQRFQTCAPDVACLQGVLDFYNPRKNWLARCFTMEYATWFRMILPGIARLGLVVPLGGTTLFFRRDILDRVGGWDAHNVTEDADLGLRLYRHDFRTELVQTTTYEEANCQALPWVKQRSRWIKGYMMTWAIHMKDPVRLWRDVGPWRFFGLQVQFLCPLFQFLLAPLFWTLWVLPFGLPHPLIDPLPQVMTQAIMVLFLTCEGVSIVIGALALCRSGQSLNPLWLLSLPAYYPLATFAAYKAAWEMITNPFYWDKTSHGAFGGN